MTPKGVVLFVILSIKVAPLTSNSPSAWYMLRKRRVRGPLWMSYSNTLGKGKGGGQDRQVVSGGAAVKAVEGRGLARGTDRVVQHRLHHK